MTSPTRVPGKLGKRPPKNAPALHLGAYLTGVVPEHPAEANNFAVLNGGWQMLGNDRWGDCVGVTWANIRRLMTNLDGVEHYPSLDDVITVYKTQNPGFPSQDDGMDIQTLLEYLTKNGGPDGVKPVCFAKVDPSNPDEVKAAIAIFGYVWTGITVTAANMNQFAAGQPWDYNPDSPNDGGHSIITGGYDSDGTGGDERFVTWGQETTFTDAFWDHQCVTPQTRVLTRDLRWVPAGELREGDHLLGFDEEPRDASQDGYRRRGRLYRPTVVEQCPVIIRPCYELTFDDGSTVRCSSEHKWLVGKNKGAHWVTTENLVVRNGQASRIIKPLDVWGDDGTRESGYLAAAFDGEGCLVQRDLGGQVNGVTGTLLTFSQVENAMLAETERCLKELDFPFGHNVEDRAQRGHQTMHRLNVTQRKEVLRFLGQVRPQRLLEKFRPDKLGLLGHSRTARLVKKEFIGNQSVVALQTSTRTFFAEGLASHNCDEAWVVIWPEHLGSRAFLAGVDQAALAADYTSLTGRDFPVQPTPEPGPAPPQPAPSPVPVPTDVDRQLAHIARSWLSRTLHSHAQTVALRGALTDWMDVHYPSNGDGGRHRNLDHGWHG